MKELIEIYKNLELREKIKFDREYINFNKEEKLKQLLKRKELLDDLNKVINEDGKPYFSSVFIDNIYRLIIIFTPSIYFLLNIL
jgi:hypothetical protein